MKGSRLALPALLLSLVAAALPARAAIFGDDEARRAIVELRTKVTAQDEATRLRIEKLEALVQEQLAPMRRSVLDLNGQIEQLRGEVAKLRGQNEQLARDLSDAQRGLKDQAQTLDSRLKPLEPQKVSVDGYEFQVSPDERNLFDAAMGLVRRGEFDDAAAAFVGFQRRFPASGYSDTVRFWLGNAQYGMRNYKDAIATFRAYIAGNADHPRVPEAMLAVANCQIELKDGKAARKTLQDLIKAHPNSEAAKAAKERLASLK